MERFVFSLMEKFICLTSDKLTGLEPGTLASRFVGDVDTVENLFTSGIISMFEDEEEQREAAELFHTTLPELSTRQERERAFHDILLAVKKNSYQYYMAKLGTDVNAVKQAVEGKKALEELQRTHISLE